mgnify:CR=1 FL=1
MKEKYKEQKLCNDSVVCSEISDIDLQRYSRQILLPDIGIAGQKFLLSSIIHIDSQAQHRDLIQKQLIPVGISNFVDSEKHATASIYFFSIPKRISDIPMVVVSQNDNASIFEVIPAGEQYNSIFCSNCDLLCDIEPIIFITIQLVMNLLIKYAHHLPITYEKHSFQIRNFQRISMNVM